MNLYKPARNPAREAARLYDVNMALNHPEEVENACVDNIFLEGLHLYIQTGQEAGSSPDIRLPESFNLDVLRSSGWKILPDVPVVPYVAAATGATMAAFTICQCRAAGMADKGKEGEITLEGMVKDAVEGQRVTAMDMLCLPAPERTSMEEFHRLVRDGKIEKWSEPSYVLSREEKKEAKAFIKEFYREEYTRYGMDEETLKKSYQIAMLENKTRMGAGIMAGMLMAVPFSDQLIEGMDSLYEKAEKATGMEGGYNLSEAVQASAAQHPNAFRISEAVTSLGMYAAEASLIQSIPVVGKLTGAAGSRAAALAERLGAKPALQRGIAAGVARITADQTVDTMVHTVPGIVSDAREGKKVTEVGLNALKAEGEDLGLNIGSELVLDAAGIAVKKVVGAVRGGKASVREQLLDSVSNDKLKNCINEMYRPGATTGDGGLADAIRHELTTGELVGGKSHITKGLERVRNLENIIAKQNLDSADLKIATDLLNDLKSALELGGY